MEGDYMLRGGTRNHKSHCHCCVCRNKRDGIDRHPGRKVVVSVRLQQEMKELLKRRLSDDYNNTSVSRAVEYLIEGFLEKRWGG
jgi:hypothetical protein